MRWVTLEPGWALIIYRSRTVHTDSSRNSVLRLLKEKLGDEAVSEIDGAVKVWRLKVTDS